MNDAHYRSKVTQTKLNQRAPEMGLPNPLPSLKSDEERNTMAGSSWGWWALGLGLTSIIAFAVLDAVLFLQTLFAESPIISTVLAGLLLAFLVVAGLFINREVQGYRSIEPFLQVQTHIVDLASKDDRAFTLKTLQKHAKQQAGSRFAQDCYHQFFSSLKPHHSNAELLSLYEQKVHGLIHAKAQAVLKKESLLSGGLAFVSPNSLIQTTLILWVSVRTLRRIAQVYGLRPGKVGGVKLLRITLENLAAQGVLDVISDEIANQIGSSLAAKFIENSAQAVAASALNIRLGKALIRQLEGPNREVKL
ncbi:DUF697 domain-containing protein [Thiomicrorhabdus aquaedulcis]|uniref:DUF697 domain-containing protein n=1 Tax=Thiomicrorhabdus aquaedulcis TaxID=2211106 RepID=UPI000FDB01DA|nr:DUF697 domain-containing protein [Thiomicrorhabdus aquaedulcis]